MTVSSIWLRRRGDTPAAARGAGDDLDGRGRVAVCTDEVADEFDGWAALRARCVEPQATSASERTDIPTQAELAARFRSARRTSAITPGSPPWPLSRSPSRLSPR